MSNWRDQGAMPARFWGKVDRTGECWVWTGTKSHGYGNFSVNGKMVHAHQYAWEQRYGPRPQGTIICHTCDNPACVRVEHLFLGTYRTNMQDCVAKRRQAVGERNGRAKLTWGQIKDIRERHAMGQSKRSLAQAFQCSWATIHNIVRGLVWKA